MSSLAGQARAPGSFSSIDTTTKRPPLHVESSESSEEISHPALKARPLPQTTPAPPRPFYALPHGNFSTGSLQNFSRPTTAQRDLTLRGESSGHTADQSSWHKGHSRKHSQPHSTYEGSSSNSGCLSRGHGKETSQTPQYDGSSSAAESVRGHGRGHLRTQCSFEPYLPTAANSSLGTMANTGNLTASQIAAQAAMQHQAHHNRHRSQTVPSPHFDTTSNGSGSRRPSRGGPHSPPALSLTEASAPRGGPLKLQTYHEMLGGHQNAAQTAANAVFPKSPTVSPSMASQEDLDKALPERPLKTEKSKVKLFSRPGKISISKDKDPKTNALPSPSKLGHYTLASLQKMNLSTLNVTDSNLSSASSMYSLANSSSATIRAVDQPPEKERDREKHKHNFLSRQKHKLDHHLPLSSAASNSKPVDPNAPSILYNFNLPPSPGPSTTSFAKSMSGLDLRHGGRALREKKKEEKSESALRENESSHREFNEWPGPPGLASGGAGSLLNSSHAASLYGDAPDMGKYGLNNMGPDDAWPLLKAKLLIIFEGEDLRLPVEDFNRLVSTHVQRCIQKRSPVAILDDIRDLLATGFTSLDATLLRTPDERIIPHLVEMWLFTFTSILPYMQAVFLPLDLEFSGNGTLMTPHQAREFFGGETFEVRRLVLTAYRNVIILPRFESLKQIFSRLSLDSLSLPIPVGPPLVHSNAANTPDNLSSSPPDSSTNSIGRPGTAMSFDPSLASYSSSTSTLINATPSISSGGSGGVPSAFPPFAPGGSSGNRSRTISNTSTRSDGPGVMPPPPPPIRPFTPSTTHPSAGAGYFSSAGVGSGSGSGSASALKGEEKSSSSQERNVLVEHSSNHLTETVGRMLQCTSVLSSLGDEGAITNGDEQRKMEELNRALKLNWLGRGRTGGNRRGLVGARVPGTSVERRAVEVQ